MKTISKEIDTSVRLGMKELVTIGKDTIKESRDMLSKVIRADIKLIKKNVLKGHKVANKVLKKAILSKSNSMSSDDKFLLLEVMTLYMNDFYGTLNADLDQNLFLTLPYTDFIKSNTAQANLHRTDAKNLLKEDTLDIQGNFVASTTTAGPTLPEDFEIYNAQDSSIQVVMTRESDSETATCDIGMIEKVDDCSYGPIDDLKFKYLCEMGGGEFNYGTQSYNCATSSFPSSLFCEAPAELFLQ